MALITRTSSFVCLAFTRYTPAAVIVLAAGLDGCSSESTPASEFDQSDEFSSEPLASDGTDTVFGETRPETIDLARLSGENGFSLAYEPAENESTRTLQGIGDVDGDGISDFSISTSTRTWVVPGSGARLAADGSLATLDTGGSFRLDEGLQLTALGDINGDGIGDVGWLIHDDAGSVGVSGIRVVFGRGDGEFASALQGLPNGLDGFAIIDEVRRSDIRSLAAAGDLNADGFDDVLVGAYAHNGEDFDAPNAWVIYGRASGFSPLLDVATLSAADGLTLETRLSVAQQNAATDSTGTGYNASVTGDFDFNGDGIDDIAIGASRFDWIENVGTSHTYVVYGSAERTAGTLDMTALDGLQGVDVVGPELAYQPSPDGVSAVGDINADGIADLAIVDEAYTGGVARVLFGGFASADSRIDRTALPPSASIEFHSTQAIRQNTRLGGVGDIDGDGIDDLGVQSAGDTAIVYGRVEQFPAVIDVSLPTPSDVTRLGGSDMSPLVPLGDIDADGVDDLGIGWVLRETNAGTYSLGDINEDGVDDLGISAYEAGQEHLIHVLYGFGSQGFAQVPADQSAPEPLKLIDPFFFNRLLAVVDLAARSPIDYLNDELAAGVALGPVAASCIGASLPVVTGSQGPTVESFDCGDESLSFSFGWGVGKYTGVAGGSFSRAAFSDGIVQALQLTSVPVPTEGPGGNPYQAHLSFDRDAQLVVGRYDYLDNPQAPRCVIDVATRSTTDDDTECALLIGETRDVLLRMFGTRSDVRDFQYLPLAPVQP